MTTRYPFAWDIMVGLARDLPSGRRSLIADCVEMTSRITPAPVVRGTEHIPVIGPVVVAANHYQRRGLWIAWPGAVITAAMASYRGTESPLHWLVTGGLRWMQWRSAGPEVPGTRAVFQRVACTYGMTALPLSGAADRSAALRGWLRWARDGHALGIFPEGLAGGSNGLRRPEPGFDALARHLARRSIPVLPCGIFEVGDGLHIRFGACVQASAGEVVMEEIARLLPAGQRGVYG